jgi:demethylmenaquinone methyltransferase/2-methoxy-6-polyprenyl-1,4-benzoquinol methylase
MAMLRQASRRSEGKLALVQGSAFRLPFRNRTFGGAVSAFVLRNLDDLARAFEELARVLAPGGRIVLLDITEPSRPWVRRAFDAYFRRAAPAVGALVGKREDYRYLVASLSHLPDRAKLCRMLNDAGFMNCSASPMSGGVVTLLCAVRAPQDS